MRSDTPSPKFEQFKVILFQLSHLEAKGSRSIQGFYGVTYALGFRDDFLMQVDDIIDRICALENRIGVNDEAAATLNIKEIRQAAKQTTHMYVVPAG